MYPASKQRVIEILLDDVWQPISSFGLLEVGDVIRMFESDGSVVSDKNGATIFTVTEQPILVVEPL